MNPAVQIKCSFTDAVPNNTRDRDDWIHVVDKTIYCRMLPPIMSADGILTFPLGICLEIPSGYAAVVQSQLPNSFVGLSDSDYRGELRVWVFNVKDFNSNFDGLRAEIKIIRLGTNYLLSYNHRTRNFEDRPKPKTSGAAGIDLYYCCKGSLETQKSSRGELSCGDDFVDYKVKTISFGQCIVNEDCIVAVMARSSIAKKGVIVPFSPHNYVAGDHLVGNFIFTMKNQSFTSETDFAQAVFINLNQSFHLTVREVDRSELSQTERGEGSMGSTDKRDTRFDCLDCCNPNDTSHNLCARELAYSRIVLNSWKFEQLPVDFISHSWSDVLFPTEIRYVTSAGGKCEACLAFEEYRSHFDTGKSKSFMEIPSVDFLYHR